MYLNFKQYDTDQFKLDIFNSMSAMRTHAAFEILFQFQVNLLLRKQKILQGNQKPCFNKNIWRQIMITSRLKNKVNKSKNPSQV